MLSISNFLKYSIYIGHSASNSLMLSAWFLYKLRKKIWIINLFKTVIFVKLVFKFLQYLAVNHLPFWFVNLELSKEFIFKKYAFECGEFACTKIWIRGFLSNFKSIQNSIGKYILKKHIYKQNEKKYLMNTWSLTRFTWPRGIFLSNISLNYVICKEANSISLPVVALVDTNIKSFLFNYPVPANDDSLNSINYILSLISKKLLLYKYKKITMWYNKYKAKKNKVFRKVLSINKILRKNIRLFKKNKKKKLLELSKKKNILEYHKKLKSKFSYNLKRYLLYGVFNSKYFKKKIYCNLFNRSFNFIKNCNMLTQNYLTYSSNKSYKDSYIDNISLLYKKLNYLKKIKRIRRFYNYFLVKNKFKLQQNPLSLYAQTIKFKYYKFRQNKKKKSKKKFYLFYYLISNYLRKSRVFHETFFINKPSKFVFLRAFHKYNKPWYNQPDTNTYIHRWRWWNGYRYKINYKAKYYWLKNRFNSMLKRNWKYNKKLWISDSAILFNISRWVTYSRKPYLMRKLKRSLLTYWLYPFFKRFSVKENFRWYNSKFFYKEDLKFKQYFNWNAPKIKTPLTTFHFYNNWFTFLLQHKIPQNNFLAWNKYDNVPRYKRIPVPAKPPIRKNA